MVPMVLASVYRRLPVDLDTELLSLNVIHLTVVS